MGRRRPPRLWNRSSCATCFEQTAPPWVRHFARLVAFQAENGRLDRTEYNLPAPPPETLAPATLDRWNLAVYALTLGGIFFIMPGITGA